MWKDTIHGGRGGEQLTPANVPEYLMLARMAINERPDFTHLIVR